MYVRVIVCVRCVCCCCVHDNWIEFYLGYLVVMLIYYKEVV